MYCTQSELEADIGPARLIELTDISAAPTGAVDGVVMSAAISAATSEIDSYIGRRYGVPLPIVSDLVRDICIALTLDRLFKFAKPEEVKDRAAAARKLLVSIASGSASIPDLVDLSGGPLGDVLFAEPNDPVFSRDTLSDYNA